MRFCAAVAAGDIVLDDDVHPSAAGYATRAQMIADALSDSAIPVSGTNDGPVGDAIAAAAFMAAGVSPTTSRLRAGGATTVVRNGLRIQIILSVVGNHHDHVHVGIGLA